MRMYSHFYEVAQIAQMHTPDLSWFYGPTHTENFDTQVTQHWKLSQTVTKTVTNTTKNWKFHPIIVSSTRHQLPDANPRCPWIGWNLGVGCRRCAQLFLKSQRNRMQSCVATCEIHLIFLIIIEVTVTLGGSARSRSKGFDGWPSLERLLPKD